MSDGQNRPLPCSAGPAADRLLDPPRGGGTGQKGRVLRLALWADILESLQLLNQGHLPQGDAFGFSSKPAILVLKIRVISVRVGHVGRIQPVTVVPRSSSPPWPVPSGPGLPPARLMLLLVRSDRSGPPKQSSSCTRQEMVHP